MRVAAEVRGPIKELYLQVHNENALGMLLRPGSMEFGRRRSALRQAMFNAGEMGLCTPFSEHWVGTADMEHLTVSISAAALTAACDGVGGRVELHPRWKMTDAPAFTETHRAAHNEPAHIGEEPQAGNISGNLCLFLVDGTSAVSSRSSKHES